MSGRIDQCVIDEVRERVSLVEMVGRRVKLRRAGQGYSGLCPFHKEKTPSFHVCDQRGTYHCYGCGAHGDAFKWVEQVDGCSFRDAVALLAGQAGIDLGAEARHDSAALDARRSSAVVQREARPDAPSSLVSSSEAGRWIYRTAGPARGEIVERWLIARGLDPRAEFAPGHAAIDQLLFHPRCPLSCWKVHEDPASAWRTAPAMVAPIRDGEGLVRGVHVTFLSSDGRSKARVLRGDGSEMPSRKMFGKVAGCSVSLSPPPTGLTVEPGRGEDPVDCPENLPPSSSIPLIVGEGVETVWSYAQSFGRPCRPFAALSLHNLQGRARVLNGGALPLWRIEADPAGPPFLVEQPGEVIVLVDADMKPLRDQEVQTWRGGKPVRADIDGLKRAEICATLAAQHWQRAGATKVSAVRPRMGNDFNDAVAA